MRKHVLVQRSKLRIAFLTGKEKRFALKDRFCKNYVSYLIVGKNISNITY